MVKYFAGERLKMLLILSRLIVATVLTAWLWAATRSGFALAAAVTVLAPALLFSATAGSLLMRDKTLSSTLARGIESSQEHSVVATERERVEVVVSKYKYYWYGAALIAAIGVLGLILPSARDRMHGIAAELLLLVLA